jgi:hypothetical protein
MAQLWDNSSSSSSSVTKSNCHSEDNCQQTPMMDVMQHLLHVCHALPPCLQEPHVPCLRRWTLLHQHAALWRNSVLPQSLRG